MGVGGLILYSLEKKKRDTPHSQGHQAHIFKNCSKTFPFQFTMYISWMIYFCYSPLSVAREELLGERSYNKKERASLMNINKSYRWQHVSYRKWISDWFYVFFFVVDEFKVWEYGDEFLGWQRCSYIYISLCLVLDEIKLGILGDGCVFLRICYLFICMKMWWIFLLVGFWLAGR